MKRKPIDILNVIRDATSQLWYGCDYSEIKGRPQQVIIHESITGNFPKKLQRIRYGVYKLYDGTILFINDLKGS